MTKDVEAPEIIALMQADNLTDEQRRVISDIVHAYRDTEKQNDAMRANRRLGLVWETESYKARFSDPIWGTDHEHGAVVMDLVPEHSRPEGDEGNLIIEGDNVDALRVLARTHRGRFDCIFIDPPYNTEETTFVYNDKQVAAEDRYRYSLWLEGLKRRLQYVPDLLSERGVLLVAINDEQRAYVELTLNQVMPNKRVGSFVWRCRTSGKSPSLFSDDHEHVLVYANGSFKFKGNDRDIRDYKYNHISGRPARTITLAKGHDYKERPNTFFPIYDEKQNLWYTCDPQRVWAFDQTGIERLKAQNGIHFPSESLRNPVKVYYSREEFITAVQNKDVPHAGKGQGHPVFTMQLIDQGLINPDDWVGRRISWGRPSKVDFLDESKSETKVISSWMAGTEKDARNLVENDVQREVLVSPMNSEATDTLASIFGEKLFNYAKPPSLITNLIRQSTTQDSLVLDFFGGSGTTAEAVLRLNEEDGGNRKFVLASNTEKTEKEPDKNLCRDVLARRVCAVIDGFEKNGKPVEGTGGGFAYLRSKRVEREGVLGYTPFEMTPQRIWNALCMMENAPVTDLVLKNGFALIFTETRLSAFVPVWGEVDADALAAAFRAEPEREHVLYAELDQTASRAMRERGLDSVRSLDAWNATSPIYGPVV